MTRRHGLAGAFTRRAHLLGAAGLLGAPAALAGACVGRQAAPAAQPATLQGGLELWLQDVYYNPGTLGDTIVKEFAQQHPGLSVNLVPTRYDVTKLPASVAAGVVPDVSHMDRYLAAEWGTTGVVQPLDTLIRGSRVLAPADWREGLRNDVTWQGKVYAVPQGSDVWVFYWNTRLYQEVGLDPAKPPATWDEVKEHSRKLFRGEPGGAIERYGFAPHYGNGGAQAAWLIFMWQQGQDELSPDRTKAVFNTPAGLRALELVLEFITAQGGIERYTEFRDALSPNDRATLLPVGKVAAHLDYHGLPVRWKQIVSETNHGTGLIPKPAGGKDTTYQGGPTHVVPTGAKNPQAGIRFLEHLSSRETELRWADTNGAVPTSIATCQSEAYLGKQPERKIFVQLGLNAKWVPCVPGAADILKVHSQFINEALSGQKSPREAITWAQTEIQRILDERLSRS
jgi:multiple sugar transport system substrate-binding protein